MRHLWLYISFLTIAGVIANPLFRSRFPIGNDDDEECSTEDCSTVAQKSVCGTDSRTYSSKCELMRAKCRGSTTLEVKSKGSCQESYGCEDERRLNQEQANLGRMIGLFIPECNDEGGFKEVQCHTSTGYCWCVTEQGKPIPGSSMRYQHPKCNADDGLPLHCKQGKYACKRNKGCSQSERQVFNHNLISIFKDEYARLPTKPPVNEDPDSIANIRGRTAMEELLIMDSLEKKVIDWKFSELDTNSEGELDKKELKSITKKKKVPTATLR